MPRLATCFVLLAGLLAASDCAAEKPVPDGPPTFEAHVRPLFKAYCFDCHGEGDKLRGGLDLRHSRPILQGGDSGPAVVPRRPDESLLYRRVRDGEMPPTKKKLTPDQVELIGRWIIAGAKAERPDAAAAAPGMVLTPEERAYWAFRPVRRPPVPAVQTAEPVRTPIDAFLLARLQARGLAFAPEADRRTLIRRAAFDLTGLPPTPEEVDAFVADPALDAYEQLIDRYLASPHYGERWGRHWLDVAGYADSEGYAQEDNPRPNAYKYRDYVIRSFNADKPFDRFVREQLAGDEMLRPPYGNLSAEDLDLLIATGFLRMAPDGTGSANVDQKAARNQVVADTIKIVSSALLGLSVGCAQCHNHRYDPIPQTDYYRLRAILEPALDVKNWRAPAARQVSLATDADRQKAKEIEAEAAQIDKERLDKQKQFIEETFQKELAKLPEDVREPVRAAWKTPPAERTAEQKKLLMDHPSANVSAGSLYLYDAKAAAELQRYTDAAYIVRARKPVEDFVRALTEVPGSLPVTYLFHRGDPDQPKQPVAPGGLTVLDERLPLNLSEKDPALPTSGRRLAFAHWLTGGDHPLTARVFVNRVWLHHFGRGLVGTPGDFGKLGERPTHPELLDWLASEFVAEGWSVKRLHRLILTSTAYRQSSRRDPVGDPIDPDNRLLGRMPVRRLEAEAFRDAVLAVSGSLSPKAFGPPVPVRENEVGQIVVGKGNKDVARGSVAEVPLPAGEVYRRSVYVEVRRSQPLGLLETFDAASTEPNCEARIASTVTPQALLMMNSDFMVAQSEAFAARLRNEAGEEPKEQVMRAWRLLFAAEPSEKQVREALAFLTDQTALFRANPSKTDKSPPAPEVRALAVFCQALLSANRFLYVD
jgi:mono/diheme cytochrome c family protein